MTEAIYSEKKVAPSSMVSHIFLLAPPKGERERELWRPEGDEQARIEYRSNLVFPEKAGGSLTMGRATGPSRATDAAAAGREGCC